MLHGISKTTIPMNISWLPRLIVAWETSISVAKPPVNALAMFMRSSWKAKRPRKSRGSTEKSTLGEKACQRRNFSIMWRVLLSASLPFKAGIPFRRHGQRRCSKILRETAIELLLLIFYFNIHTSRKKDLVGILATLKAKRDEFGKYRLQQIVRALKYSIIITPSN